MMARIASGVAWRLGVLLLLATAAAAQPAAERLRVMVETDLAGDPDDEQSMVRFLLYANEWDVEGILANRPRAREGENLNPERTGLGIARRFLRAYGEVHDRLRRHDPRYPSESYLAERTVAGYAEVDAAERLLLRAVDSPDPRPLWFMNWGTDSGSAPSNLLRALDRVRRERGPEGYARFKARLRLSSADKFGPHTAAIAPPFPIWVDTFRPEENGRRWYHRFSALTERAGGFDLERDVRNGHGPLGALYPTNTRPRQKEGDSMAFLLLVPNGLSVPGEPGWGSWAGRYGPQPDAGGRNYHWANQRDAWNGTIERDHTLARWAAHLQNDFRARMDWCVKEFSEANHPPRVRVTGPSRRSLRPGETVSLDAGGSDDPDGHALRFEWMVYPDTLPAGADPIADRHSARATFTAPAAAAGSVVHVLVVVTDAGEPALTRYARIVFDLAPSRPE